MPTILIWGGYRFLFYSKEDGEPPHIHVLKENKQLKVWLDEIKIARRTGFRDHEVVKIMKKIKEQREMFLEAWHDHFGDQ